VEETLTQLLTGWLAHRGSMTDAKGKCPNTPMPQKAFATS